MKTVLCLVFIFCFSDGKFTMRELGEEMKHYRDTLEALNEKVEDVVNLEWRINNLEKTLDAMEEGRVSAEGGESEGKKEAGTESKVSLKEINRTVAEASAQMRKMELGLTHMSESMDKLENEVKSLEEWRKESELAKTDNYGEEMTSSEVFEMTNRLTKLEMFQEDIGSISHKLQNETHDLRDDVASLVGWVRRLKDDFQTNSDAVWNNLTSLWKELRSDEEIVPVDVGEPREMEETEE